MENNVNCEEMRFVIRNLVDVEVPPRQRRHKFLLMSLEATSVFPQRGRDNAAQRRQVFPSDIKPRLSNQQENQATQRKQPLHTNNNTSQPDLLKGLQSLWGYGARNCVLTGESCNILNKQIANKIKCSKVFLYFWFNRSENKWQIKVDCKGKYMRKTSGRRRFHQWFLSRKIANGG